MLRVIGQGLNNVDQTLVLVLQNCIYVRMVIEEIQIQSTYL